MLMKSKLYHLCDLMITRGDSWIYVYIWVYVFAYLCVCVVYVHVCKHAEEFNTFLCLWWRPVVSFDICTTSLSSFIFIKYLQKITGYLTTKFIINFFLFKSKVKNNLYRCIFNQNSMKIEFLKHLYIKWDYERLNQLLSLILFNLYLNDISLSTAYSSLHRSHYSLYARFR